MHHDESSCALWRVCRKFFCLLVCSVQSTRHVEPVLAKRPDDAVKLAEERRQVGSQGFRSWQADEGFAIPVEAEVRPVGRISGRMKLQLADALGAPL